MQNSSSYIHDNTQTHQLLGDAMQHPSSSNSLVSEAQFHYHAPAHHQQHLHQHNQSFLIMEEQSRNSSLLPLSPTIFSSAMPTSSSTATTSVTVAVPLEPASYHTTFSQLLNSSQHTIPTISEVDGELPLPSFLEMFGPMLAAATADTSKFSRAPTTMKQNTQQFSQLPPPLQDLALVETSSKRRKKSEDFLVSSTSSFPLSHNDLLPESHETASKDHDLGNVLSTNTGHFSLSDRERVALNSSISSAAVGGTGGVGGRVGGNQQPQVSTAGYGQGISAVSTSEDDEPDPSYDYVLSGGLGLGSDESTGSLPVLRKYSTLPQIPYLP
jgi:hypothetical protein